MKTELGFKTYFRVGCLLLLGSRAQAVSTGTMNIQAAVDMAINKNPITLGAREKLNEGESEYSLAITQLFPTINFVGSANYNKDAINTAAPLFGGEPYNQYNLGFQLRQPLFQGGAEWAGLAVAKIQKDLNQIDFDTSVRDLTVNVIQGFYQVILNQEKLQILLSSLDVQNESLKVANQRYRIGRGQLLDVLSVKSTIALLEPQIAQAKNQLNIAATQLALLLGDSSINEVNLKGSLLPVDLQLIQNGLQKETARFLEVDKIKRTIDQTEEKRKVTLAPNYPQLAAVGTWNRISFTKDQLVDDSATGWAFGIQLTIPLFSGLSSVYQRSQLASQITQLEIQENQVKDTLSSSQVQAQQNLDYSWKNIKSSENGFKLAEASFKEAQKDFRLATIDFVQFLTINQNLLNAESAFAQSRYDYVSNLSKYYQAWGYPMKDLVETLAARGK